MPYEQVDLVASLIEEADFTASLAESLHQVARRVKREKFSPGSMEIVNGSLNALDLSLRQILPDEGVAAPTLPAGHVPAVENLRQRTLQLGKEVSASERGAILALLGSVERAELLVLRIEAERKSVDRSIAARRSSLVPRKAPAQEPPAADTINDAVPAV